MRRVLDLNIQQKLNFLMVSTLVASSFGIVATVTDLFTSDIGGLLRKSALESAAVLSGRVRTEMKRVAERAEILAATSLEEYKYEEDRLRFIEANLAKDPDYVGLAVYRKEQSGFVRSWQFVHPEYEARKGIGWNEFQDLQMVYPVSFSEIAQGKIGFRVAQLKDGTSIVRMGLPLVKERDGEFSRILVIDLKQDRLNTIFEESTGMVAYLVDGSSKVLATTPSSFIRAGDDISSSPLLAKTNQMRGLASQVEFDDERKVRQIAAVQRVGFAGLSVVTQIPYSQIENAQMDLFRRSLLLTLVFAVAAIILSVYSSETIARPIRALSSAADRVATGDFSARVPHQGSKHHKNEVSILTRSFNSMAGKIEDLMLQTAAKARMEKELETAKLVQSRFMPNHGFEHRNIKLHGKVIPATECGGDWWQYASISHSLIVVMGDVTGHGASSALVTAAANGAFFLFLKEQKDKVFDPETGLRKLVEQINTATLSATVRQASMTLVASVIDLETGTVFSINACHPSPVVYRNSQMLNLVLPEVLPLGDESDLSLVVSRFQLEPSDMILWYTDGLSECTESSRGPGRKQVMFKKIDDFGKRMKRDPQEICGQIQKEVFNILGVTEAENVFLQQDDITIAVATVPQTVRFKNLK